MPHDPYLSAQEAADTLGISVSTLYAYVSRGLISSEALGGSGPTRTRRYHEEDIRRLIERKEQRRDPSRAAAEALYWGAPVLESAITLPAADTFYYRGYDAVELARRHTIEEVAVLIWTGEFARGSVLFSTPTAPLPPRCAAVMSHLTDMDPTARLAVVLPLAADDDPAAYDLRPNAVTHTGARMLRFLTTAAVGEQPASGIAEALGRGWAPGIAEATALLDAALILCADQELNVTSFAARCVASAGASPYAVVSAGLAALGGAKHAGRGARIEALLHEVGTPDRASEVLAGRLRRGEEIPGFGHPLFPQGDPRGRLLLELTGAAFPEAPPMLLATAIVEAARDLLGEHPDVEIGLVTLAQTLGLPAGGASALFALGRTIGWIGHAMEEYQADRIIRPRARYIGEHPRTLPQMDIPI
ncbi:MAG: citrate synthase family protein [Chloroflexota bacterium]